MLTVGLTGFFTSLSLILAIGAQNTMLLRQGLTKQHIFWSCLFCSLSDAILIIFGIFGFNFAASKIDTVIIRRTDTADNGKIVVALIDEHEAMLKRIRKKGKVVALESANRNYETKIFGPDRVKVQGVLVSLYRNF